MFINGWIRTNNFTNWVEYSQDFHLLSQAKLAKSHAQTVTFMLLPIITYVITKTISKILHYL